MFLEAPDALIREIYVTEELIARLKQGKMEKEQLLSNKLERSGYETVTEEVMKKAADTQTPQGILSVLDQPRYEAEDILSSDGLYLILENLQDPGNLGSMFRT